MQSNTFIPKNIRLQKYIEYFWYISSGKDHISIPDPILYPETSFDVVLSFGSPAVLKTSSFGCVKTKGSFLLSGMRKEPFVVNCTGNEEYLAIRFYPDGLYYFLKDSLDEVNTAQSVELNDLSGKVWRELTEKAANVRGLSNKLETLEAELIKILDSASISSSWVVNETLNHFHKTKEQIDLKDLVKNFGIYPKRLEREFKKYIGITPKLYSRILRFNNVIRYMNLTPAKTHWAETAQKFGYFDQSHFIKEFTNFLGLSPEGYFKMRDKYFQS